MVVPTRSTKIGQFEDGSNSDVFQIVGSGGAISLWMDYQGVVHYPSSSLNPFGSKTLWVDNNRTDAYAPNGNIEYPFKSISDAVSQIIANGDNSSIVYVVAINAGNYPEVINLDNSVLTNLVFLGYGVTVQGLQIVNNDNLGTAMFFGLIFNSISGNQVINFQSTTNDTLFGSVNNGIAFYDCTILSNGGCYINNCSLVVFDRCFFTSNTNNFINIIDIDFRNSIINEGSSFTILTASSSPSPNGFVASQLELQNVQSLATVTIGSVLDSVSSVSALTGCLQRNSVIVYGIYTAYPGSRTSGSITVKNGGTFRTRSGSWDGTLTVNAGGAVSFAETLGVQNLLLNGSNISAGVGSPSGVVTGNPGDLYLNQSGGAGTTLWVKESGTQTNTGWVGK